MPFDSMTVFLIFSSASACFFSFVCVCVCVYCCSDSTLSLMVLSLAYFLLRLKRQWTKIWREYCEMNCVVCRVLFTVFFLFIFHPHNKNHVHFIDIFMWSFVFLNRVIAQRNMDENGPFSCAFLAILIIGYSMCMWMSLCTFLPCPYDVEVCQYPSKTVRCYTTNST